MKILIDENDPVSRRMLEVLCRSWGFEVTAVQDGVAACKALENEDAPPLAILDWMMPGMDGIEVTRKTRAKNSLKPVYIILLTARSDKKDVIEGLWADADDYITKPFNHQELRANSHRRTRGGVANGPRGAGCRIGKSPEPRQETSGPVAHLLL